MSSNIHASCVVLKNKGVLIKGVSSSGKSDLCLRLIMRYGARLIADDRVDLTIEKNKVIASAPKILKGLLEVRGIGIIKLPVKQTAKIDLVINLTDEKEKIDRIPEIEYFEFNNIKIRQYSLCGKEDSCPDKILAAITLL
ncbi:MAG: hypothetical protein E7019_05630 [Alphaproteobacteria bacterium]|nr:hypothetical protein [Alphaproteobacteria bacterium]